MLIPEHDYTAREQTVCKNDGAGGHITAWKLKMPASSNAGLETCATRPTADAELRTDREPSQPQRPSSPGIVWDGRPHANASPATAAGAAARQAQAAATHEGSSAETGDSTLLLGSPSPTLPTRGRESCIASPSPTLPTRGREAGVVGQSTQGARERTPGQSASIQRVALIFDDKLRPETTGTYCRRALDKLVEVKHFLPADVAQIPPGAFDLYLQIDDGLRYGLPPHLRPSVWWAIDTHMDFSWCLQNAKHFDWVFAAQRDGAAQLRDAGISSASWLPLACDPELHGKLDAEKRFDVTFVGHLFPGPRADLVRLIQNRFRRSFVGQRYFEEMARTYSTSRIVFNRSIANDVNMRVFEALASGSLLMTNDLAENGQSELFQDGVHLATYRDTEELLDKLAYYLRHEEVRERIAAAGREEVLACHTYRHRMQTLLQKCRETRVESRETEERRETKEERRETGPTRETCVARTKPTPPYPPLERGGHASRYSKETGTTDSPRLQAEAKQSPAASNAEAPVLSPAFQGEARVEPPAPVAAEDGRVLSPPFQGGARGGSVTTPARDRSYFEFARPELLALIPPSAKRVLDIGCGAGMLGAAIKARQPVTVCGIELDQTATETARTRLDQVWVGDAEEVEPDLPPASFDAIVCGDILEHLRDPGRLLPRARTWLAPTGVLVASIPNVRHHSVIRSLLDGNWTYEPAGLLDRDHVRFFTRRAIEELFRSSGFAIHEIRIVPGPGYEDWESQGKTGSVDVGRLHIQGLAREDAEEFYVYQYLVTAKPAAAGSSNAASSGARDYGERRPFLAPKRPPLAPPWKGGDRNVRPPIGAQLAHRRIRAMHFTQNFLSDFDEFDFWAGPFAFVRFGDGERAICARSPVTAQDGWSYAGENSQFSADLNAALRFSAPDYYIGISDGCCDQASRDWYLERVQVPLHQLTFANIFVNWNYRRFRALDLSGMAIVAHGAGDFLVPNDLVRGEFDLDGLVEQLLDVDRPMLVAAGPASCIIVHKYWMRATRPQTIVNVGSAIDERTKGAKTRQYQHPGSRTAELICQW